MALTREDLENILKKKSDEAIECFETAIIIDFNDIYAHYGLYYIYCEQGNYSKAFKEAHLGIMCCHRKNLMSGALYSELSEALLRMATLCRENQTPSEVNQTNNDIGSALDTIIELHEDYDNPTGFLIPIENWGSSKAEYHIRYNPNEDHYVYSAVICMLVAAEDDWKRRLNRRLFNIKLEDKHFHKFVEDITPELSENILSTTESKELNSILKELHGSLIAQYVQTINDFFLLYDYYYTRDNVLPQMYLYNLMKVEEEMSYNDREIKKDLPKNIIKIKSALVNLRYLFLKRVFFYFPIEYHDTLNYGMEESKALLNELVNCMSNGIFPGKISGLKKGAEVLGIDRYFDIEVFLSIKS